VSVDHALYPNTLYTHTHILSPLSLSLYILTVISNSVGLEEVNFGALKDRDLTHRELGHELRSLILGEVESLSLEFSTAVFALLKNSRLIFYI
jgi:hypothetical protein